MSSKNILKKANKIASGVVYIVFFNIKSIARFLVLKSYKYGIMEHTYSIWQYRYIFFWSLEMFWNSNEARGIEVHAFIKEKLRATYFNEPYFRSTW